MEKYKYSKEVIFDSKVEFLQNFLDLVRLKYHSNHEKLKKKLQSYLHQMLSVPFFSLSREAKPTSSKA